MWKVEVYFRLSKLNLAAIHCGNENRHCILTVRDTRVGFPGDFDRFRIGVL